MYKKTTKELVNRICEMLNEHGFVDTYVHGEKAPTHRSTVSVQG